MILSGAKLDHNIKNCPRKIFHKKKWLSFWQHDISMLMLVYPWFYFCNSHPKMILFL